MSRQPVSNEEQIQRGINAAIDLIAIVVFGPLVLFVLGAMVTTIIAAIAGALL